MPKSEVLSPYPSVPIRTHPYLSVHHSPGFKQAARAAGAAFFGSGFSVRRVEGRFYFGED